MVSPIPVWNHINPVHHQAPGNENETEEPGKLLWNLTEKLANHSSTLQEKREAQSDSTIVNMAVQSVSQQAGQTSAPVLWSSSVSGSQLAEWEKHSSTQHKCLIILLKNVQTPALCHTDTFQGHILPLPGAKETELWRWPKINCLLEGERSLKKTKILGALFYFIWSLVFDVNTSGEKKQLKLGVFFFLHIIHYFPCS